MAEKAEEIAKVAMELDIEVLAMAPGRCPPGLTDRTEGSLAYDSRPRIESTNKV
jgi:hypothetical protein